MKTWSLHLLPPSQQRPLQLKFLRASCCRPAEITSCMEKDRGRSVIDFLTFFGTKLLCKVERIPDRLQISVQSSGNLNAIHRAGRGFRYGWETMILGESPIPVTKVPPDVWS